MSKKEDNLYWNKKDGSRILITDMSDTYLKQTIRDLEKAAKDKHGRNWKTKIDPKYHILKIHALGRNLIKK
jgi:hypothetical protein